LMASVSPAMEWVGEERLLDVVTGISGKFVPLALTLKWDCKADFISLLLLLQDPAQLTSS